MPAAITAGIALGFGAALSQSVSYFFTRLYVLRSHQGVLRLMILGHLLMAGFSWMCLAIFWPSNMPPLSCYAMPLLGCSAFYLLGQACFFYALRHADASRAAPLLGLKIVVLAALGATFLSQSLMPLQWLAVALGAAAAVVLSYSGERLPVRAMLGIALACVFFSLSDLSIVNLIAAIEPSAGRFYGSCLSAALTYAVCGVLCLPLIRLVGAGSLKDLLYAVPFAASWLAAMGLLFGCFAFIGPLFGNIIQSTRGLLTIAIGARLAGMGMYHLERKISNAVLIQRASAAALMMLAIALFLLGK